MVAVLPPELQAAPSRERDPAGLSIHRTAEHLRNYMAVERACLKSCAGWFLACGAYEVKYRLAYHAFDHSEHVSWMRERLEEMRGGRPDSSVRPALKQLLAELPHAPDEHAFLEAMYGVLKPALRDVLRHDLADADPSANANEVRLLTRILADVEAQITWYGETARAGAEHGNSSPGAGAWAEYFAGLLAAAGGVHGEEPLPDTASAPPERPHAAFFTRPTTIRFDERIARRPLMPYEERLQLDERGATVEQFKVFFNEFYAAALLASILYDAAEDDLPWAFHQDFTRHFWDEARHSEFGALRLAELGETPDRCDPVLFEHSQGLPVLHRIAYLTRGLEAYFMPRKPKRFKEYQARGDSRSQLFADQDWSDEINHVRYGSTWTDFLLENDARDLDEIIDEVKQHLSQVTGREVTSIDAPF